MKRDFSSSNSYSPKRGGSSGGSRFGGGSSSWDRGSRGGSSDREGGRSEMHSATCSTCGNRCEVPFKPNGMRPVYCSNCFKKDDQRGGAPSRFEGGSSRPSFRSNDRSSSFPEKRMFQVECDGCGNECEVPFRPTGEKPVYCHSCFGGNKFGADKPERSSVERPANNDQFKAINEKLDAILKLLNAAQEE